MASRAPGRRGLSHHLKGREPREVARLLTAAVRKVGGPNGEDEFLRSDLLRYFREEQGMTEREAEAFAGELVYGGYAFKAVPGESVYVFAENVYRLIRHRAWRFPRGQLDLPAALQFIDMVKEAGGSLEMTPDLRALYQRLKDATKELK